VTEKFGTLFRKAREAAQMGMGDMAALLKVSLTFLSDVERNQRPPLSADRIILAADAMRTDPSPLLKAAAEQKGVYTFDLSAEQISVAKQVLSASLLRGWSDLSDEAANKITAILKEEERGGKDK
jgi:transcriptional regulator with XRE-family HTH domain